MNIVIDFDKFTSTNSNLFSLDGGRYSFALRSAVTAAADTWSSYLTDIFPGLQFGTTISVKNPNNPNSSNQDVVLDLIPGMVIFVGSSAELGPSNLAVTYGYRDVSLKSSPLGSDEKYLEAGLKGINYQPYAASISFSSLFGAEFNPGQAGITSTQNDIYLVALHEIGHALGFNNDIPAVGRYINLDFFNGINQQSLLRIDGSGTHIQYIGNSGPKSKLLVEDGLDPLAPPMMLPEIRRGPSTKEDPRGLTQTDVKFLADIGYQVKEPAGTLISTTPLFAKNATTGVYSLTVDSTWNATSTPKYNGIIAGNFGDDSITGNAENEFIAGGPGNDTIAGGVGNDSLYGGEGNDRLLGDAGDDSLFGGLGNDSLFSGGGVNVLVGAGQNANGKYGFNEIDTLVRSAFSLKTTFVIGSPDKGNFYKDNDLNDYAIIQGYMMGQDVINVSSFNSTTALLINNDTYIFDGSTNNLIAKVLLTSPNQILYKFNFY
jgi:hypothetical protein